ncbi:translocation protein Sec62-domain-containing protein [Terfezia claveryi]|nr:translocation protein Sec62-domain-containing protein [Terfezia claveryi]
MAAPAQQGNPQPTPAALAVAKFLKSQDLKMRTCILNGQRKDLFKVKRAIRALESPAYDAAQKKNPIMPSVTNRAQAEDAFRLMPLNLLALRVSKADAAGADNDHGHSHGGAGGKPAKRVKGLWTVKIEQQQEIRDELYYTWFYEGPQWKNTLMAIGVLIVLLAIVMFPLWPPVMRLGVWYLSMGMLGLLGLFFLMAIFRLILFCITYFALSPGLWLYPNLFEDVGFFDSFRPVWAWHKVKKPKQKKFKKDGDNLAAAIATDAAPGGKPALSSASSQRDLRPKVEDG